MKKEKDLTKDIKKEEEKNNKKENNKEVKNNKDTKKKKKKFKIKINWLKVLVWFALILMVGSAIAAILSPLFG